MSYSSSSSSSFTSDDEQTQIEDEFVTNTLQYMLQYVVQNQNIPTQNRRRHIERNREIGHERLFNDYFSENPVFNSTIFRRRFRMQQHVVLRLVEAVSSYDPFFQQSPDCTGRMGLTPLIKCTAALRVLAYGESYDRVDEYLRIGESTARMCVEKFADAVISIFGSTYLRSPTISDLESLLRVGEERGFPGMLGSIDCMHWQWKNCPAGWRGQFQGRSGRATVILEAVASQDLWIWHSFFGIPGSCNDINVLHRSPIFDDVINGRAPRVNFSVNGNQYDTGYYLTDGIYPSWATFIQSIPLPQTPKDKLFAERQESARKDVERAFGVLQARFAIIKKPALTWDERVMKKIMTTCIILHNMIVEDERDTYANYRDTTDFDEENHATVENSEFEAGHIIDINRYVANRIRLRDTGRHSSLKKDLVENIWNRYGDAN